MAKINVPVGSRRGAVGDRPRRGAKSRGRWGDGVWGAEATSAETGSTSRSARTTVVGRRCLSTVGDRLDPVQCPVGVAQHGRLLTGKHNVEKCELQGGSRNWLHPLTVHYGNY